MRLLTNISTRVLLMNAALLPHDTHNVGFRGAAENSPESIYLIVAKGGRGASSLPRISPGKEEASLQPHCGGKRNKSSVIGCLFGTAFLK